MTFKAERIRISLVGHLVPEDEGTTIIRNVENYLSNETVLHPRRYSPHSDNPASHSLNVHTNRRNKPLHPWKPSITL